MVEEEVGRKEFLRKLGRKELGIRRLKELEKEQTLAPHPAQSLIPLPNCGLTEVRSLSGRLGCGTPQCCSPSLQR